MTALDVFDYAGHQLRTVEIDGEPWFVAADVAEVLGYRMASDLTRSLDPDEKGTHQTRTPSGDQELSVISEPGLYKAIGQRQTGRMRDADQIAFVKAFQTWVNKVVLPTIRKTGTYSTTPVAPELTREQRLAYAILDAAETIKEQDAKIAELQPSAAAWDALAADDGRDLSIREAAQVLTRDDGISIGQNRLFGYLREINWIDAKNGPYQSQVDNGRLSRRVTDHTDDYGQRFVKIQPRVTTKGLAELRKRLTTTGLRLVVTA